MDRLTRRPLVALNEATMREPNKKDRLSNRVRSATDRLKDPRRRHNRAGYNRRQRALYQRRLPQRFDPRHRQNRNNTSKRLAPEKRMGVGRLRSR